MLRQCDRCDNPASVHLTEIKGGEKTERHLCENCARSLHMPLAANKELQKLLEPAQALASTLTGLSRKCPECGMSFNEFRQHGRFGCAKDYEVFGADVNRLLKRIHDTDTYSGKSPSGAMVEAGKVMDELARVRARLADAVDQENYEEAARLRDEIRRLDKGRKTVTGDADPGSGPGVR